VDGFRNPMKNELKTRPCLKRFQTRMQDFLICILIKQEKQVNLPIDKARKTSDDKQLFWQQMISNV